MNLNITDSSLTAKGAVVVPNANANAVASQVIELSERVDFNMHDAYYKHATASHFWIQWRFAVLQRLLVGRMLGDKILEVGCGNGVVQQQFEREFHCKVTGCDLNYRAMEMGVPSCGQRYLYNVLDRHEAWREYFDSVLLLDTLEHIDAPVEFLAAISSHLVPGGQLIINVPATPWLYSRYDEVQGHIRRYTVGQLRKELESGGFELQAFSYWGGTVVPVAMVRKLIVMFASYDEVLTTGFAPPGRIADGILRGLMKLEESGFRIPGCGTSLAAIATRK